MVVPPGGVRLSAGFAGGTVPVEPVPLSVAAGGVLPVPVGAVVGVPVAGCVAALVVAGVCAAGVVSDVVGLLEAIDAVSSPAPPPHAVTSIDAVIKVSIVFWHMQFIPRKICDES